MNPFLELNNLLKFELDELECVVAKYYKHAEIDLANDIVEDLVNAGGKRVRPIILLILCKIFDYSGEKAINAAAAVELIHMATLLHDDVVDDADMRRGIRSAKSIWGNKASILVGDFLLSIAFQSVISCNNQNVLQILSDATFIIAQGEIKQLINTNNLNLTYKEYLEVIGAKTAELFKASCAIAAILTSQNLAQLSDFGYFFGIAFQITDDVIDYQIGSGKDLGKDFYNGKVTLPVVFAYENADENEKEFWQRCIINSEVYVEDLAEARVILQKHGALERSLEVAFCYIKKCKKIIVNFPDSEFKATLGRLLQFVVKRSY